MACRCSPSGAATSSASAATSRRRASTRHGHPPAVHDRRVLQVRRRGGTARALPGSARPPAAAGLRVPRHRAGPQRGRRAPGRRRARHPGRARPDLAARPERAAGLRSYRRRHRSSRHRTRPPHLGHRAERGGRAVIPLAPRTARAIDLAIGERCEGPIFTTPAGQRLDRHGAGRIVRRVARRAGLAKKIGPHTLRHAFITASLDAGVPLRDVQEAASHADPRTTMRYDRARVSLDRHATYIVAAYIAGAAR
jgi:integrase